MEIIPILQRGVSDAVKHLYQLDFESEKIALSSTRSEFEGDYTVVVFPFVAAAKKKPEQIGEDIGTYLQTNLAQVTGFNVIKGFLNLVIGDEFLIDFLRNITYQPNYGQHPAKGEKVMIEFSSPNTNKPLHLGHIRNILLGWSCAQILEAAGYDVVKVQIINDRGIAICKSMLAWQKFGKGATPISTQIKSDHFVGDYYVLFEKKFQVERRNWIKKWIKENPTEAFKQFKYYLQNDKKAFETWEKALTDDKIAVSVPFINYVLQRPFAGEKSDFTTWRASKEAYQYFCNWLNTETAEITFVIKWQRIGIRNRFIFYVFDKVIFEKNKYFNQYSALGKAARTMLLQWEGEDPKVRALWQQMNQWVYDGFETTYRNLGVSFDKLYYESDTYLLGKETIEKGLTKGVFYQKDDQSVWIDLTDAKLDHKIVLRSDGTSVYITQDIGTAQLRYNDFGANRMVYVVADEQNYHFQVLFETMKRLGEPYADGLYHLSYGMVDLPTGKMKSREGTVVDADDLMAEVISEARKNAEERGEIIELSPEAREAIIQKIGMAALKFFIIKVQPKKRMIFDPKESVDMQGQTGPYVQNAYVRIQSILRKAGELPTEITDYTKLQAAEKEMINKLYAYPNTIAIAAQNYDPSEIANYCYDLAKSFHKFYHDFSILRAESEGAKQFRLLLSKATANVLESGMKLLGIEMPERM